MSTEREQGRAEAFALVLYELRQVKDRSFLYDKPGLRIAIAVVQNTQEALRLGVLVGDRAIMVEHVEDNNGRCVIDGVLWPCGPWVTAREAWDSAADRLDHDTDYPA